MLIPLGTRVKYTDRNDISNVKKVIIYTDGACRGNPGVGGWAALLRFNEHEKMISGYDEYTTNNRMELTAAIKALAGLKKACQVELYTDSIYVQKGISVWLPNWKRRQWRNGRNKPIKNVALWRKLDDLAQGHVVKWHWVKGHSGHQYNERVDQLANEAIDRYLKEKE